MIPNTYAVDYIKRATTSATIEPPDPQRAGQDLETLGAIYTAHTIGKAQGAMGAWSALRKIAPHLDRKNRRIMADDLKYIRIPNYAVSEYPIYDLGTNLFIGTRGAGKSFIALDIVAKIACAQPNRAVVYCAGEAISAYAPRWEAWKQHNQKHPKNVIFWDGALQLLNPDDVAQFMADVQADKPAFIVIDTVARSMAGANENDTAVMSHYANQAEALAKELTAGLLLVHHEGRNGLQRGSSALDGAVDSVLSVKRQEKTIILYNDLEHGGKNRHQAEAEPRTLEFLPLEVEINGFVRTSAVIVPAQPKDEDEKLTLTPKQLAILDVVDAHGELQRDDIISATGISRATLYRHLTPLVKNAVLIYHRERDTYSLPVSQSHTQ
jgi:hypothetical protein